MRYSRKIQENADWTHELRPLRIGSTPSAVWGFDGQIAKPPQ
jgi:hypothetical protein